MKTLCSHCQLKTRKVFTFLLYHEGLSSTYKHPGSIESKTGWPPSLRHLSSRVRLNHRSLYIRSDSPEFDIITTGLKTLKELPNASKIKERSQENATLITLSVGNVKPGSKFLNLNYQNYRKFSMLNGKFLLQVRD